MLDQSYEKIAQIADTVTIQAEQLKALVAELQTVKSPALIATAARNLARELMLINQRLTEDAGAIRELLK